MIKVPNIRDELLNHYDENVMFRRLAYCTIIALLSFACLYYFIDVKELSIVNGTSAILIGIILNSQKLFKKFYIRSSTIIGVCYFTLILICHFLGGFNSTTMYWFLLIIVTSAVFLTKKSTLVWALLCLSTPLQLLLLEESNLLPPPKTLTEFQYTILHQLSFYGVISFFAYFSYLYIEINQRIIRGLISKNSEVNTMMRILEHDISNPLMVAKYNARKVSQQNTSKELDIRIEKTNNSIQVMCEILESVRMLNKIHKEEYLLETAPCSLLESTKKSLILFEHQIKVKSLQIDINIDESHFVLAEREVLENQVISNVLSNAIKFTAPNKSVSINSKVAGNKIYLEIENEAEEIPEEVKARLFHQYSNFSTTGTSGERGTGFGLPIADSCMQNFGGSISLSSNQKVGKVSFILKFKRS